MREREQNKKINGETVLHKMFDTYKYEIGG